MTAEPLSRGAVTGTPEDIIRDALRLEPRSHLSEERSREALAALGALVRERDDLMKRLRDEQTENARLHRIEDAAHGAFGRSAQGHARPQG